MSLITLLNKIPVTHVIPYDNMRGEIINNTFKDLNNRSDISFNYYEYKILAILLAGLDTSIFTSEELELLLNYDWNKLEVINDMLITSQLNPANYVMETNNNKLATDERYRKRKFASLRQYIINGV